jgi:hypothetical protein
MRIVFIGIVIWVVMVYLFFAMTSYLDMLSEYRRNRLSKRPLFWRWILPIPGNSDWFYRWTSTRN